MASSSNSAEVTPPWVELPPEITEMILQKLDVEVILTTAEKVCRTWWSVCRDAAMWRRIDIQGVYLKYDWDKMCREVVDRSQGQLVDINIQYFGSDDLLLYISRRSPKLRHLGLAFCHRITNVGVREAIKNFPLLEELHLYYMSLSKPSIAIIKSVGRHCPQLKSFKLNRQWYDLPQDDEEALAIAENMPELLHLQLFGNKVSNDGVLAILKGCPNLESLDLRQCYNVDLEGALGRLCQKRIQYLRQPDDDIDDYEFCLAASSTFWL